MEVDCREHRFSVAVKDKGTYFSQSLKCRTLNASFAVENLMHSQIGNQFRVKFYQKLMHGVFLIFYMHLQ